MEARKELLEREKELTHRSDELARQRQELPWVPVEKEYVFETNEGSTTLAELFDGRSQLIVYHFMHGPNTPDGCPGCTFAADGFDGAAVHLEHRDERRMGWSFPWVSSGGTDFNRDFGAFTEEERRAGTGFNFGTPRRANLSLDDDELMALSAFVLEDGVVYHTYTCYDRGTDVLNPTGQLLDRAPKGRGGDFEGWPRRHDEYDDVAAATTVRVRT